DRRRAGDRPDLHDRQPGPVVRSAAAVRAGEAPRRAAYPLLMPDWPRLSRIRRGHISSRVSAMETRMAGYVRTAILMAAMTALFMGVGWLLAGGTGVVLAFVAAAAMNAFAWWNSDSMV